MRGVGRCGEGVRSCENVLSDSVGVSRKAAVR